MKQPIPIAIMIWGFLMGLLPLVFVGIAYFDPAFYGENWAAQGLAKFGDVYGNYVARNAASALIMFFALWQRNAAMLIVAFLMRIFSDLFDVIHNTIAGTIDLFYVLDASFLATGCLVAIYFLWGKRSVDIDTISTAPIEANSK